MRAFLIAASLLAAVILAVLACRGQLDWPGLGSNIAAELIGAVLAVGLVGYLYQRRQQDNAAAILRSAILKIDEVLAHTAQGYQAGPELAEGWFVPQIAKWKSTLDRLQRGVHYSSVDLPHPIRQRVQDLEEHCRFFAEDMRWQRFRDEGTMASKRLNDTWLLMVEIQRKLYPGDKELIAYLEETERTDLIRMRAKFEENW